MKKLSKEINELLQKESTIEFLTAARQFIDLLENNNLSQQEFYKKSHLALANLY